jgi:hypothetical protein
LLVSAFAGTGKKRFAQRQIKEVGLHLFWKDVRVTDRTMIELFLDKQVFGKTLCSKK